jgi:tetratricopeptide (TPR) repeat protein
MREEVLALRRKTIGLENLDTLMAMRNLAISFALAGRREDALKLREELLALYRKVSTAEHPDTIAAMGNLATSYEEAGRREEALKLREEALALSRKVSGPEHPDTILAMEYLASSYEEAGRFGEAIKMREEALSLFRKVIGPERTDTFEAMELLAVSYDWTGRYEEALKLREEVLSLCRRVLGPERTSTLEAMQNLAFSYEETGLQDKALQNYQEALTLYERLTDVQPLNNTAKIGLLKTYQKLGDAFAGMGKPELAVANYQNGLHSAQDILARDSANAKAAELYRTFRIRLGLEKSEVVVLKIVPRGQAEQKGLREGDVLVSYAGKPVLSASAVPILTGRARGTGIEMEILRDGTPLRLRVNPGPLGAEWEDRTVTGKNSG